MFNTRRSAVAERPHDALTQLISTQLTTPKEKSGLTRGKKLTSSYNVPDSLVNSQNVFFKVAIVSQLISDIGKLFHTSIILTVKKKFPNIQMHLWFVDFECVASQSCA